jgi:hypothetical protein
MFTKEQIEEMKEAAKPLVKFICENCNPYGKVIVECGGAELLEASAIVKIEEFIKD